jgi:hypothetical protein
VFHQDKVTTFARSTDKVDVYLASAVATTIDEVDEAGEFAIACVFDLAVCQ